MKIAPLTLALFTAAGLYAQQVAPDREERAGLLAGRHSDAQFLCTLTA